MGFEAWQLGLIDEAGYNGVCSEHITRVAEELRATGLSSIDRSTFENACYSCCIDPDNFTQSDLEELERALNE